MTNKNGNSQGKFIPTPVNFTKADGTQATWKGRGRMPAEIKIMLAEGTYTPPSVIAKAAKKAAKTQVRAAKAEAKAAKKAAKTQVTE